MHTNATHSNRPTRNRNERPLPARNHLSSADQQAALHELNRLLRKHR